MSHHKKLEHHTRPYKIAAQTTGLVACLFIFFFIGGKGLPSILKNDENELTPFLPLIIASITGYIITWYKEVAGTLLMAIGGMLLLIFFIIQGDVATGLVYGLPFIVAGAMFILHIYKRSQLKNKLKDQQ